MGFPQGEADSVGDQHQDCNDSALQNSEMCFMHACTYCPLRASAATCCMQGIRSQPGLPRACHAACAAFAAVVAPASAVLVLTACYFAALLCCSGLQGGWEDDETVEAAAQRETVEEAGVRGSIEVCGRLCSCNSNEGH